MKANELMIGDWVTFKDCQHENPMPIKIIAIGFQADEEDDCLVQINGDKACDIMTIDDEIVGIPITAEILEKNGFKIDKNETYCKRYFFACNLGKIPQTVVEFSFYGEGVSANTLFKCWTKPQSCDGENSIHICDLKYVHELQHALRLCGIEKEIEL